MTSKMRISLPSTYDWDPGEMGIPADRLRRVWQMRPLTAAQPWGVFFLEFVGSRLPITQVRHVLRVLVTSKRAAGFGFTDLAFG